MGRGENRKEVILPCPNRSFRFVSAMIVRRDTLKVNAGLGGLKEGSEFGRDFVIDLDVGERMGQRREELGGRAIGSHIRGSSSRLKGNKVDIIIVDKK